MENVTQAHIDFLENEFDGLNIALEVRMQALLIHRLIREQAQNTRRTG